jgi:hypothetical protein
VDVKSLDFIELVDFDLNELFGTRIEHPRADSLVVEARNKELTAQEQLQEAIIDVI